MARRNLRAEQAVSRTHIVQRNDRDDEQYEIEESSETPTTPPDPQEQVDAQIRADE
ncbi:MAG: hypothetical protein M1820_010346, partial [Bogoriella megaspora]